MPKVLIIDDDVHSRLTVVAMLQKAGFEVRAASSGKEGLESIRLNSPDAVILDCHMGDMDGLMVLNVIRDGGSKTGATPVIVLTGDPGGEPQVNSLMLYSEALLIKPVSQATLVSTVQQVLAQANDRM